jgi:hypothetical protein
MRKTVIQILLGLVFVIGAVSVISVSTERRGYAVFDWKDGNHGSLFAGLVPTGTG